MLFSQLLRSISRGAGRQIAAIMGGWATEAANSEALVALTYGATVAVDASRGNVQSLAVTNGTAYTISTPTNPPATGYGQLLAFIITNAGAVVTGLGTFGAGYTEVADIPALQVGEQIVVTFRWNGSAWVELSRSTSGTPLLMRRQVTALTDAQIKAWPTAVVDITPVAPTGKMFLPMFCLVTIDSTAGAYTNVSTSAYLSLGDPTLGYEVAGYILNNAGGGFAYMSDLLGVGAGGVNSATLPCPLANSLGNGITPNTGTNFPPSALSGKQLVARLLNGGAGNLTGGNAANSGKITTVYIEVDAA